MKDLQFVGRVKRNPTAFVGFRCSTRPTRLLCFDRLSTNGKEKSYSLNVQYEFKK
jgi:hypothetical protein